MIESWSLNRSLILRMSWNSYLGWDRYIRPGINLLYKLTGYMNHCSRSSCHNLVEFMICFLYRCCAVGITRVFLFTQSLHFYRLELTSRVYCARFYSIWRHFLRLVNSGSRIDVWHREFVCVCNRDREDFWFRMQTK